MPDMRPFFLHLDADSNYKEIAAALSAKLLQGELNPYSAMVVAESAFFFEPEVKQLDEKLSILDLSSGPTGVFKDFGISFLAAAMEELLKNAPPVMFISAASGDVGTSIANAFNRRRGMTSVILYPQGEICGINSESLLRNGGSIVPIQIKGTLEDCNRLIADIIRDRKFAGRYRITSANTINPGRLLSQTFYYIYAFVKLKQKLSGDLFFSVPCGNLGNLIGGLYAWKFGLPVDGFIAAQNINNPMKEKNLNAAPEKREKTTTLSPELDIIRPSNRERLAFFYEEEPELMKQMVDEEIVTDEEMTQTMKDTYKKYGIILDPHGALALAAAKAMMKKQNREVHIVVLATGHASKHPELVSKITGEPTRIPAHLRMLKKSGTACALIDNDLTALEAAIAASY
jgi:threonine synthase